MTDKVIKPEHNTMNGKNAWDTMIEIAEANPVFDKKDVVFLTLMLKHIPRAGRKSYGENSTKIEDKILDLKKSAVYLNAWIEMLEDKDAKDKAKVKTQDVITSRAGIFDLYPNRELTTDVIDITDVISEIMNGDGDLSSILSVHVHLSDDFSRRTLIPNKFGEVNVLDFSAYDIDNESNYSRIEYYIQVDKRRFYYVVVYDHPGNDIFIKKATLQYVGR